MEEQACPRCKTTKYRNPALKLLVNVCGHTLCENCVELLFVRGSGACQECGVALRRTNFRVQLFEDAYVEKEVDIRKRVLKDYNKKEEDFPSLRDYNDYLEEIETIIFNLANAVDVEETKKRIEQYRRENQHTIKKNRTKLSKEEEELNNLIEIEQEELEYNRKMVVEEELREKNEKKKSRDALIDELMFSDISATQIVAAHKKEIDAKQQAMAAKTTKFSTGIRVGKMDYSSARKIEGTLYKYEPLKLHHFGPTVELDTVNLEHTGYLMQTREATDTERGGGFLSHIACKRTLQEAFCGLFFTFDCVQQQLTSMHTADEIAVDEAT